MARIEVSIDSLLTAAGEAMRKAEQETNSERKIREEDRAYGWAKQAVERMELRREFRERAAFHKGSGSVYDVEK